MAAKKKAPAKKRASKKTKAKPKRAAMKKAAAKARKTGTPAPGDMIERTYKGKTYKLRVTEDGFALGKRTFTSLTAAAKHVTSYSSISGVRFWLGTKGGRDG